MKTICGLSRLSSWLKKQTQQNENQQNKNEPSYKLHLYVSYTCTCVNLLHSEAVVTVFLLHFMVMIFCFSKSQREIRFLAQLLPQQENKKAGALTYANQHGTASVWAAN